MNSMISANSSGILSSASIAPLTSFAILGNRSAVRPDHAKVSGPGGDWAGMHKSHIYMQVKRHLQMRVMNFLARALR